ncbi:hypothetical protein Hanom_Chr11g01032711 [Helianthus anomalus]
MGVGLRFVSGGLMAEKGAGLKGFWGAKGRTMITHQVGAKFTGSWESYLLLIFITSSLDMCHMCFEKKKKRENFIFCPLCLH